jgi:glycosyltransferase involved in cell wall biosynthesis
VEVIPNGIDLHDLGLDAPPPTRPRSGPLRMLTVGRLSVEKGIEHLLAACRLLEPDVDYELTIAGTGPLEADLRNAAADLPRIRFVGVVPRASLGPLYRDHDLFVTATLNEAFALVVLEALACGLPIIGTDIEALRAVVTEGQNGLLVAPGDPRAIADAVERVARDEPLRLSLAANAHGSVLPRYGWGAIGDEIASIISRMRA